MLQLLFKWLLCYDVNLFRKISLHILNKIKSAKIKYSGLDLNNFTSGSLEYQFWQNPLVGEGRQKVIWGYLEYITVWGSSVGKYFSTAWLQYSSFLNSIYKSKLSCIVTLKFDSEAQFCSLECQVTVWELSIHYHHYDHHNVSLKRKEPRRGEREELECFISYFCSFYFPTSGHLNRKRYTAKFLCSFQVLFDFIFYCIWRNASETEKHMIYNLQKASFLFILLLHYVCRLSGRLPCLPNEQH